MGECDLALAGGANVLLTPATMITFSSAHMLAPDGRCKTFDAAADGYVRGEGCGIIVIKRLEDAIRDGDRIRAVIRGSAINQDGASGGLTVPNGVAQQRVIADALKRADLEPSDIGSWKHTGPGRRWAIVSGISRLQDGFPGLGIDGPSIGESVDEERATSKGRSATVVPAPRSRPRPRWCSTPDGEASERPDRAAAEYLELRDIWRPVGEARLR